MEVSSLKIIGYFLTIYATATVIQTQESTCDVSVHCSCCVDGGLSCTSHHDNHCEGPCKDGYYGARCIQPCPDECVSCHQSFGQTNECYTCTNGRYGKACKQNCFNCATCMKDTGVCINCANGYYGQNCTNMCSKNCVELQCDIVSGNCYDCNVGYYGTMCMDKCSDTCKNTLCDMMSGACPECMNGYYGTFCDMKCSQNCVGLHCDRSSGKCTACNIGNFGDMCNDKCSDTCENILCNRTSGVCQRCINGYYGAFCNKMCDVNCLDACDMITGKCTDCIVGAYGKNCNLNCPNSCKGSLCERILGNCTNGCVENFDGDKCEYCITGKHGIRCDKNCPPNCLHDVCTRTNGTCAFGCKPGFSDSKLCCVNNLNCDLCSSKSVCTHCVVGKYGQTCEHNCPHNCDGPCAKTSGACDKCELNYYGLKCDNICSETCFTANNYKSRCKPDNGKCEFGCLSGFHGNTCELSCSDNCNETCHQNTGECYSCKYNRYGNDCAHLCFHACAKNDSETVCNKSSGSCLFGCLDGFYETRCDRNCSLGCQNQSCERYTGYCTSGCTEGFSGQLCLTDTSQSASHTSDAFPTTTIGVAAGLGIAVLAMVVVLIVVIRKRRSKPGQRNAQELLTIENSEKDTKIRDKVYENVDPNEAADDDAFVPEADKIEVRDEHTYYNSAALKTRTEELYRYLSKSDGDYQKEFLMLPSGLIKPYSDAKTPINAKRNRYNMVYPYNASRVRVKDGNSDYINASYIDGYKKKTAYIACLGPTKKILGDFGLFWKMIWQEKVETIVMVTKLKEGSGMKCDQYWPNAGKTMTYGNVKVHSIGEEEYAEFIVRNMTISMDKDERQFHHIHFTAWPDKGVPSDVISIVNLRNKVLRMRKKFDGPLVVHCSAGIGRTGTYIALDILINQGQAEHSVDVLGCIIKMRDQRVHMVQTVDQYKYLHHAVMWSLSIDTEPVPADSFVDLYWIYQHDGLAKMLKQLQMENWYDTDEEKTAVDANKMIPFANRDSADIPGHRHAVRVMRHDTNRQMKADYINAVFIDGYRRQGRFIAAQTPLPETLTQFLDMIVQRRVGCIIDMEPPYGNRVDVGEYLPEEGQEVQNGNVVFRTNSRKESGIYIKRDIQVVEDEKVNNSRIITHYQFNKWPMSNRIPDPVELVKLIHEVEKLVIQTQETGPILVHCMNGAERSALFCAMWLLIERMGADHSVSVLNTLRQVKSRRRIAIPNTEQIEFCFKGVAAHLNLLKENVYSNL